MLKVLVNAERCAVKGYAELCNMTAGKDHRTYELSLAILNEEVEHESWFSEFLGEGPSGHGGVRRESDIRRTSHGSCRRKEAMALTVGARLRHYDVTALIDEGSRGEVYVAG